METRYFGVFWKGISKNLHECNAIHAFWDYEYPSNSLILKSIIVKNNLKYVEITNIIEFTKKDFVSFFGDDIFNI